MQRATPSRPQPLAALTAAAVLMVATATADAADPWRAITTASTPELAADEIQFLEVIGDELWIGTLSGLSRYRDGRFAAVDRVTTEKRRDPVSNAWTTAAVTAKVELRVCAVHRIGAGNYLVGAAGGLFRMRDLVLGTVALEGLTVAPVLAAGEDTLWALGKDDGSGRSTLYSDATGAWTPVAAFADRAVIDCLRTRDGRLWVVVEGDGVYAVDPARGADAAVHHLGGHNVRSLLLDRRGRVWCGLHGRGVAMHEGDGTWRRHRLDGDSAVLSLASDTDGGIWAGTASDGVFRFADGEWSNAFADEGAVSLLYADGAGRVWVSTQVTGGLRYHRDGTWHRSLDTRMPMTSMVEFDGALWAGGVLDGIHVLEP